MLKTMNPVQRARRGLAIFFAALIVASVPLQTVIVRQGYTTSRIFLLVWIPCFASMIARVVMREGIADVSFQLSRSGARLLIVGWLFPVAVGTLAYGIGWSLGLAELVPAAENALGIPYPGDTPLQRMVFGAGFSLTLGVVVNATLALGEEIGWRGYLLTRLMAARVPQPALITGLVWGSWHVPLILSGRYMEHSSRPALSAAVFIVTVTGLSYIAAQLRLESGSIWPVVVMHAAWNSIVVMFFDDSTRGPQATFWLGEGGLLVTVATGILAMILVRARPSGQRAPSQRASELPHTARL